MPSHYERLSALDAAFLAIETETSPMHVGAVAIFEAGPLARPQGGIDIDRIRGLVEALLVPRYRQRIARIPVTNHPVWVDDPRFNLHYHVRHMSLPAPGDERQLKRLAGHVMSLPLDRTKPLWELWVVEGLARGRFAILTKTHHCMIDGVGSADLMVASMSTSPTRFRATAEALAIAAGPESRSSLSPASCAAARAVGSPPSALPAAPSRTRSTPRARCAKQSRALARRSARACTARRRPRSTSRSAPIAASTGCASTSPQVKEVKKQLGGTVNDVVLATVAGALRRFLGGRRVDVAALEFRAMVPVNIRTQDQTGAFGNRVATMSAKLPLAERSPRKRLARVIETTRELKSSKQAHGVEIIEEISELGLTALFAQFARLTALTRPFNVVVTNVPGPQFRTYLLGAPLRRGVSAGAALPQPGARHRALQLRRRTLLGPQRRLGRPARST